LKSNTETKQLKHIQNYLHKNNHKKKILHFVNCKKKTQITVSVFIDQAIEVSNTPKTYNKMKKVCYRIGVFPSILVLSTK
jgi:hypothetical protein